MLLEQQYHRCVAILGCQSQSSIAICVHRRIQKAVIHLVTGLNQRCAVLVHAGSQHGADHCDVAKRSRTLQTTVAVQRGPLQVFRRVLRVATPRVQLLQAAPADQVGLVHARQSRQLHCWQVAQHQDDSLGRLCRDELKQLTQLVLRKRDGGWRWRWRRRRRRRRR